MLNTSYVCGINYTLIYGIGSFIACIQLHFYRILQKTVTFVILLFNLILSHFFCVMSNTKSVNVNFQ